MHHSDVQSSYIPNSSFFQATIYPVGVSKVRSLYAQINFHISMKLCCVVTKIGTRIWLYMSYKRTKFQLDQRMRLWVWANFVICAKRRRKIKPETLVSCISETPGAIYLYFGIQLPLLGGHFHSKFGDLRLKGHESMNAWKSLLFVPVNILTPVCVHPGLLGLHNTLLCALILAIICLVLYLISVLYWKCFLKLWRSMQCK